MWSVDDVSDGTLRGVDRVTQIAECLRRSESNNVDSVFGRPKNSLFVALSETLEPVLDLPTDVLRSALDDPHGVVPRRLNTI